MLAASYISKIPTEVVDLLHKLFTGQMPATAELLDKHLAGFGVGWSWAGCVWQDSWTKR